MQYDGREVANFVLNHCDKFKTPVTNMALQKIIFFCHAWSLVTRKEPLVRHNFEAWQHGPVLPYLYHEFKCHGDGPITTRAKKFDKKIKEWKTAVPNFDGETEKFLMHVVARYSSFSASWLRELSHVEGGPWASAWNHIGRINPGMKLSDQEIATFYSRTKPPPLSSM